MPEVSGPAVATIVAACLFLFAAGRAIAAFMSLRPHLRGEGQRPRVGLRFVVESRGRENDWDRIAREGWVAIGQFRTWTTLAAIASLLLVLSLYAQP